MALEAVAGRDRPVSDGDHALLVFVHEHAADKGDVISSPLQGLISVKTSRMGSSNRGVGAAGTGNRKA